MSKEIFAALAVLEKEKGIPKSYMLEKIAQALLTAYRRDHDGDCENVVVEPDEATGDLHMYVRKTVVEEVFDPETEILPEDAKNYAPSPDIGDVVSIEIPTMNFGRIAAQTAKQVIIQGIREAEQGMVFQRFTSSEHELVPAVVNRVDNRSGNVILEIGSGAEKSEMVLPMSEQVRGETLREGDHIRVYVVEVKNDRGRPRVVISRTHPGLVRRLFELNVPEIRDGIVEVMSISREAGSRTKIAVRTADEEIDPVGACVGPRGERVNAIVSELRGEKIDIIRYSEDPAEFIAAALAPASVIRVDLADEGKSCRVIVPDDQLSLAIGREGQNARLAVKLVGYKIDIKPLSQIEFD
jgi:N utilization substance protein A